MKALTKLLFILPLSLLFACSGNNKSKTSKAETPETETSNVNVEDKFNGSWKQTAVNHPDPAVMTFTKIDTTYLLVNTSNNDTMGVFHYDHEINQLAGKYKNGFEMRVKYIPEKDHILYSRVNHEDDGLELQKIDK